jgi:hypothetical membrane protein
MFVMDPHWQEGTGLDVIRICASAETLLVCGIVAALLYPATDILATSLYPGYSYRAQAVSELFAIGAPTSRLVVTLLTIASLLFLGFAAPIPSPGRRASS